MCGSVSCPVDIGIVGAIRTTFLAKAFEDQLVPGSRFVCVLMGGGGVVELNR